jgi:transcriptional regulator with XRE-family HTH domain
MRFPNLLWAIAQAGTRYQFAGRLGVSAAWLSRRLLARAEFSQDDRQRIAKALGYPSDWLFAKPAPPVRRESPARVCALESFAGPALTREPAESRLWQLSGNHEEDEIRGSPSGFRKLGLRHKRSADANTSNYARPSGFPLS